METELLTAATRQFKSDETIFVPWVQEGFFFRSKASIVSD